MKQIYFKDEDVLFETEECGEWYILHCEVFGWSVSKYKKMIKVFAEYLNTHNTKLVTFTPNPKFARLFGGKFESAFMYQGKEYEVVVWA